MWPVSPSQHRLSSQVCLLSFCWNLIRNSQITRRCRTFFKICVCLFNHMSNQVHSPEHFGSGGVCIFHHFPNTCLENEPVLFLLLRRLQLLVCNNSCLKKFGRPVSDHSWPRYQDVYLTSTLNAADDFDPYVTTLSHTSPVIFFSERNREFGEVSRCLEESAESSRLFGWHFDRFPGRFWSRTQGSAGILGTF